LNYQGVFNVTPNPLVTANWNCDINMLPDCAVPGAYTTTDNAGHDSASNAWNEALGASAAGCSAMLTQLFERWRLGYMSITCYQDGPDLANQGTCCAAQFPWTPEVILNPSAGDATPDSFATIAHAVRYPRMPTFSELEKMPNAYFGRSREGCYMPLKLDYTHQRWRTAYDRVYQASSWTSDGEAGYRIPFTTTGSVYPYPDAGLTALHADSTGHIHWVGDPLPPLLQDNHGQVSFQNLAPTTRITVYWRVGIEAQVRPSSAFASFLKLSPPYDATAITEYYQVARELKDAFPADYNDLGKLWDVIKGAAMSLAPAISSLGPIGRTIGTMIPLGVTAIDGLRSATSGKSNPRDKQSAAHVEAAKQAQQLVDAGVQLGMRNPGRRQQQNARKMKGNQTSTKRGGKLSVQRPIVDYSI